MSLLVLGRTHLQDLLITYQDDILHPVRADQIYDGWENPSVICLQRL